MPKPQQGAFKPLKQPRTAYTFDYAPNLPKTKQGNQHCLVVVDLASLLTRLIPVESRSAKDLISAFRQIMMADATTITYLRSDGELAAQSEEFRQFCTEHSIFHEKTVICNPHKVFGPENNDLILQLQKLKIEKVILAGMSTNLCVESHLRELLELV